MVLEFDFVQPAETIVHVGKLKIQGFQRGQYLEQGRLYVNRFQN